MLPFSLDAASDLVRPRLVLTFDTRTESMGLSLDSICWVNAAVVGASEDNEKLEDDEDDDDDDDAEVVDDGGRSTLLS